MLQHSLDPSPEPPADGAKTDVNDADEEIAKKLSTRKKRKPKLKKPAALENSGILDSGNLFPDDEQPDFFPDTNLRLALESLRVSWSHQTKSGS